MTRQQTQSGAADWRLLIDHAENAAWNMAADEAMLLGLAEGKIPPTLRFYGWNPPAVSIGYFQRMDAEIDRTICAKLGMDVVRRLTGGRAVLHEEEVTYSLVVREDAVNIPATVTASYLFFSQAIVAGLARMGISAELQAPAPSKGQKNSRFTSPACFDAPSHYEVVVADRKVVGSAQVRHNGILLQHGSVSLKFRAERVAAVMRYDNEEKRKKLIRDLKERAVGLLDVLAKPLDCDTIVSALTEGFVEKCGIKLSTGSRTEFELAKLNQLIKNKYNDEAWNCRR